jgi:hypothetical protein
MLRAVVMTSAGPAKSTRIASWMVVGGETRPGVDSTPARRAHILAQIVVLALNAALELREIGEHLIRRAGAELLARGLQPQVDTGERLRVPVVQVARDAVALIRDLQRRMRSSTSTRCWPRYTRR